MIKKLTTTEQGTVISRESMMREQQAVVRWLIIDGIKGGASIG